MTVRLFAAAAAAAVALSPLAAVAEVEHRPIEEKRLVSGKQSLSPDKGYVYLHAPQRLAIILVKEPGEADRAAYEAEWREALAEAKRRYPRKLEGWQRDVTWARDHNMTPPDRPVEPTEQNFAIEPLERRMLISLGPQFIYARQDEEFGYLHELEPGTYRYYGPVAAVQNGSYAGTCYCMGSVRFEVQPGKIANLGDFLTLGWATPEQGRLSALEWNRETPAQETDYALPARLAAFPNAVAEWRAAGKIDNFYGVMVGRMPPVPGILAYQRDRVIDLTAAGAPATGAGSR